MTDLEPGGVDLDLDTTLDAELDTDLGGDVAVLDAPVLDGNGLDLAQPPDPLDTPDVAPVTFGSTVEFPDGSQVVNPHTDHLDYVYPDRESYEAGENKHVITET